MCGTECVVVAATSSIPEEKEIETTLPPPSSSPPSATASCTGKRPFEDDGDEDTTQSPPTKQARGIQWEVGTEEYMQALERLAKAGRVDGVRRYLKQADLDANDEECGINEDNVIRYANTALWVAAMNHQADVVECLLERKGLDVHDEEDAMLMHAAKNGDEKIATLLLDYATFDKPTLCKAYVSATESGATNLAKILNERATKLVEDLNV